MKLLGTMAALLALTGCGGKDAADAVPLANNAAALDSAIEARANELAAEADNAADANAAAAIAEVPLNQQQPELNAALANQ